MSTENLSKFQAAVAQSPELQDKLRAIHGTVARQTSEKIAVLSAEAGTPIPAEEFLQNAAELSDEALESVAGGRKVEENVAISIFTLGFGCYFMLQNSRNASENPNNCM